MPKGLAENLKSKFTTTVRNAMLASMLSNGMAAKSNPEKIDKQVQTQLDKNFQPDQDIDRKKLEQETAKSINDEMVNENSSQYSSNVPEISPTPSQTEDEQPQQREKNDDEKDPSKKSDKPDVKHYKNIKAQTTDVSPAKITPQESLDDTQSPQEQIETQQIPKEEQLQTDDSQPNTENSKNSKDQNTAKPQESQQQQEPDSAQDKPENQQEGEQPQSEDESSTEKPPEEEQDEQQPPEEEQQHKCPNCGAPLPPDGNCIYCGSKAQEDDSGIKNCPSCGAPLEQDGSCSHCGAKAPDQNCPQCGSNNFDEKEGCNACGYGQKEKERSRPTQLINQLRNRSQIKKVKDIIDKIKRAKIKKNNEIAELNREILPIKTGIRGLQLTRLILFIVSMALNVIGLLLMITIILGFLSGLFFGAASAVSYAGTVVKQAQKRLEKQIEKKEEEIKIKKQKRKRIDQEMMKRNKELRDLENQSLLERRREENPQTT